MTSSRYGRVLWICGLFLIASLGLSYRLFRGQLFNPMVVFFGVWFVVFVLYGFNSVLRFFYYPLTDYAKMLMTASFAFFFLAAVTMAMHPKVVRTSCPVRIYGRDIRLIAKGTKLILLLFSLAVFVKYAILVRRYGNPFSSLESVRNDFFAGELQYPAWLTVLTTFGYLAILNLGILVVFRRSRQTILMTVWAFALVWLNGSSVAMRGGFLNFSLLFLSSAMIANMLRGRKAGVLALSRFAMLLVCLVAVMTAILYFRSGCTIRYIDGLLMHNYIYIVGSVPNGTSISCTPRTDKSTEE